MKSLFLVPLMLAAAPAAAVTITYENAGVQNTTALFDFSGVETFTGRSTGNFSTDFGTAGDPVVISATYTGVTIKDADRYGGAGGTGQYAVAWQNAPYQLDLTTSDGSDVNYFGYWLSALDAGNLLDFYSDGQLVYSFTPSAVLAAIGSKPAYFGNPTPPFLGQNGGEPYAFVNIYFDAGESFDRVVFRQTTSAGYESDNHTVGYWIEQGGNTVPEPATWAMLISGFGLVGMSARRRSRTVSQ